MSTERRGIAGSDVRLSVISFGSMRMHERKVDDVHWQNLLAESVEMGVSSCHSSDEYESFPLLCRILAHLRTIGVAQRMQHIVKLAAPHFGEFTFEPERLRQRVESYLTDLGVERLDVIQWMWRGDLKQEEQRLVSFQENLHRIDMAFTDLRKEGKVGAVLPFPYTQAFGHISLAQPWCAGLALYLNPLEVESLELVREAASTNRSILAIRPLAAGRILQTGHAVRDAISWTLAQPAVVTGIVSYSSVEHLKQLAF